MMAPRESWDGNMIIELRVGERGCGKSEQLRKLMGLTHKEYSVYNKRIEDILKTEREHREMIEKLAWGFYYT